MTERLPDPRNRLPPLEQRRASLERLGEVVQEILASTGMTEDELVEALTSGDWHSPDDDTNTQSLDAAAPHPGK